MSPRRKTTQPKTVRSAIYCRVSTAGQMNGDFTSMDNQREACEAYITSQKHEGWQPLPECYQDGGFSGGDTNRPALNQLLIDIETGHIDCVLVYKVDRLSRSLLDFARLIDLFDQHQVSLASVTENFNTSTPTGRLHLNMLFSFSQYERELISERTRDKMGAARKKGKFTGGFLILGYDLHPDGGRLVVNEDEARQVRQIFSLYREKQTLVAVAQELNRRGWTTKTWTTKAGKHHAGRPFHKQSVQYLLANPAYLGKVRHHGEVFDGEHEAIVNQKTWDQVQRLLAKNRQHGGAHAKNRYGHLLRGILRCSACGAAMSPSATKKNNVVYRYYVCNSATKNGWKTCPHPSVSATKLEAMVVALIRTIGQDTALVRETVRQVQKVKRAQKPALVAEQRRLTRQRAQVRDEIRGLLDALATGQAAGPSLSDRLGTLEEQAAKLDRRLAEVQAEVAALNQATVNATEVAKALSLFDPIWALLFPMEQERVIRLLIQRIDYDGKSGKLAIRFRPTGIKTLAGEISEAEGAA